MGMDKTLKMRAYSASSGDVHNLTREQELELELAKKSGQLEDERRKSLETLNALEHAREARKSEQAKIAEMRALLDAAQARVSELEAALERIASIAIAPGARVSDQ
jgi:chromosome segregation ATPase